MARVPVVTIEERLHHGQTLQVRTIQVWKITRETLRGILLSSIYPMEPSEEHLTRMLKEFEAMGCTYHGWADWHIVDDPMRVKPIFKRWDLVMYPTFDSERTDALRNARRELGFDPEGFEPEPLKVEGA